MKTVRSLRELIKIQHAENLMESLIFDTFPDLKEFSSNDEKYGERFISVVVPCPSDASKKLEISIHEDEVTVAFSGWHGHYSESYGNIDNLTQVIEEIFSEKQAVCSYICEEAPPIKAGAFVSALMTISELPTENTEYYYAMEIQHTSWRGTFNRNIRAEYISRKI